MANMPDILQTLHDAYDGKLTKLSYVQTVIGVDNKEAALLCCVSPHTYRRWKSDRQPNKCALRLLGVIAGYVPWAGWNGWFYNPFDQKLYHQDLKYGFSPDELISSWYIRQAKEAYEREVLHLRQMVKDYENRQAPDTSITTNPNIVAFPTFSAMARVTTDPATEKQPGSDRKSSLRDRFAGLFRRKAG